MTTIVRRIMNMMFIMAVQTLMIGLAIVRQDMWEFFIALWWLLFAMFWYQFIKVSRGE